MRPAFARLLCSVLYAGAMCRGRATAQSFPLAATTTQLTSSVASPLVGTSTTLAAKITPGPGSTTPGGIYVPGAPAGLVTFSDGSTTLGTAALTGSTLTFATASPQTISASSKVASRLNGRTAIPFQPRARSRANDTPSPDNSTVFSSIITDFNLDGLRDALILDASGNFHLLLGASPAGNFRPEQVIPSGCSSVSGAAAADLNGDGFPDIVALCANENGTSSLFAFYNLGNGSFAPPAALLNATGGPLLQYGNQVGIADLNQDGKMDLVVTGVVSYSDQGDPHYGIQPFFGDGAGHFTPGSITQVAADPGSQLIVQDLNHDGALDLVLLSSSYTNYTTVVQPYVNNGFGVFTASTAIPVCDCYTYTAKLFVTPLTAANSAYPDIVVAAPDQQQILVALNKRSEGLAFAAATLKSLTNLSDAILGDFNADGLMDLAFFDGNSINVLNGDGAGNFAAQPSSPNFTSTGYTAANVSLVAATDVNQDGYADLLTLYPGSAFTSTFNAYITTGSAVATLPATFTTAATHRLTTSYLGDVNLLGSSGALALTVQPAQVYTANVSITAPPSNTPGTSASQVYTPGGAFSLSFALTKSNDPFRTGSPLSPGGSITVNEHGAALATTSAQSSGPNTSTASLANFGSATAGVHVFTIVYSGDANFQPSTSTFTFTVQRATPTVTWTTPATINTNTPLDSTILSASASVPGTFQYTPATGYLAAGPQTLSALFTPTDSANYESVTTIRQLTVLQAASTTTLVISSGGSPVSTVAAGNVITLTATVPAISGQVHFCDASAAFCTDVHLLGTAQLTSLGTATFRYIPAIGAHTYRAVFLGSTANAASTSDPVALTVTGTFPTSTTLTAAGTPANYSLVATVIGTGSPLLTPTGTVSFLDAANANNPLAVAPLGPATTALAFTTQPVSATTGITGSLLATGDFNGDGIADLLAGSSPDENGNFQSLSVYLGKGDGTFTPQSAINLSVRTAITGDFNHDGITDIALSNSAGNAISVLLGQGDGTFSLKATVPIPGGTGTLVAADFNHDGLLDLATGSTTSHSDTSPSPYTGTLTVLLGAGDGTFHTVQMSTPAGAASLASADFNGDGIPDLVAGDFFAHTATIFLGKADGTFTLKGVNTIPSDSAAYFTTADFNGDGIADIAALDFYSGVVTILLGNGDGSFAQSTTFSDATAVGGPNSFNIAAGDFNQDGIADLAVTADDGVSIYLGSGDGTFTMNSRAIAQSIASEQQGHQDFGLLLADFNGDGLLDIATTSPNLTLALNTITATATASANNIVLPGYGPHALTASYSGTRNFTGSASTPLPLTGQPAAPVLTFNPIPATLLYGTPLPATLFNATATTPAGAPVAGTITYNHAVGDLLAAGSQTLTATFVPADPLAYTAVSLSRTLLVSRATPTLTWPQPAPITQGTPLSATQLNASAVGYNGASLPGTFVYTPAATSILSSGIQTLSVTFTPTDSVDYLPVVATVSLTVNIPPARTTLTSSANPTQYGQPTTLTATVLPGGTLSALPTGSISFFDGTKFLGTTSLSLTGVATFPTSTLTAGAHTLTATYLGDTANASATSAAFAQTVSQASPVITFSPNPSTLSYGTPFSAAQLDASGASAYIPAVPGSFAYTYAPTFTTVPGAGLTTITARFTPNDTTNFTSATGFATVTVTRATPTISFPIPPTAIVGTPLSALQLDPVVSGVTGPNLPGTVTFTPNTGLVTAGPQSLNVIFTPVDTIDYTVATTTVTLNGTAVTLTGLSSAAAQLGDLAKTITLTGTGFAPNSVARANGAPLNTTFLNTTTLTAVLPATSFLAVQTLQISVFNPTQNQGTAALPFTITPAPVGAITFTGPTSANSGDQPTLRFTLTNPYPVDLTAIITLSFAPISGGVDDPAIQFKDGGRTFTFNLTAGQTVSPSIQFQTGTVAGTIQIALGLFVTNGGTNVTPASLAPIVITIAPSAPVITSVAVVRSGRQLTVNTFGLSNTRVITQAAFHFAPASGQQIQTQDITLDVTSLFNGWYSQVVSATYGSTFLYTQTFTLDDDATVVGQVTVTLSNGVGTSAAGSSN